MTEDCQLRRLLCLLNCQCCTPEAGPEESCIYAATPSKRSSPAHFSLFPPEGVAGVPRAVPKVRDLFLDYVKFMESNHTSNRRGYMVQ